MAIEIFRIFSVIDGYTIKRVETEAQAQRICDENGEYDYEVVIEHW